MKSLRNVLVIAIALATVSSARGDTRQKEAPAPARGEAQQESPQEMVARLAAENAKLRKENKELRADNDAMASKLEEYEVREMRRRQNRGALVVPPQAPQAQPGNAVPPNWRPFEFNGATYYVVPLQAGNDNEGTKTNTLMQVEPARPPAPAK